MTRKLLQRSITLPARLSRILAGTLRHTPDGRDIDAARREMRELALMHARELLLADRDANVDAIEVYSCKRYGGAMLDVINVPASLRPCTEPVVHNGRWSKPAA